MEHFDVLIVGAGLSGVGAAYHIQTAFPDRTYAILEAREAIGGTWDLFRYPGVRAVTVHPGGIRTNIARNARIRRDPEGLGRTREQLAAQFAAAAMTSPDKAAAIIHSGVERGKARILVGPDAYLFDALARIAPTRYYAVIARLQSRLRARHKEA